MQLCIIPAYLQLALLSAIRLPRIMLGAATPVNGSGDIDNVYTLAYTSIVANGIEFDWDAANTKHLAAHNVMAREVESVMENSPLDLAYEVVGGEERYR